MKKTTQLVFLVLILTAVLLSACASVSISITPTSTVLPTNTIALTYTSIPINTPSPTKTPIPPTATVPAPDKSLEYLNGVKVTYIDTFDKRLWIHNWEYDPGAGLHTINSVLEFPAGKDWTSIVARQQLEEGQGAILDFTYAKGSIFEFYFMRGLPDTDAYKAFCVYFEKNLGRTNVWAAKNPLGGEVIPGDLVLKPDTRYSLMMAIIPDGEFLAVIWNPSDPAKTKYYHEKIGKNWSNLTWGFGIAAKAGTVLIDDYKQIEFDGTK